MINVLNFNCISKLTRSHAHVCMEDSDSLDACGSCAVIRPGQLVHPSCHACQFFMSGTLNIFSATCFEIGNAFLSTLGTLMFSLWLHIWTTPSLCKLPLNISFSAIKKNQVSLEMLFKEEATKQFPLTSTTRATASPFMLGSPLTP